ncbi:hypothetical protein RCL1_002704 [Eukaryota sp. TZLM3-RCL]
MIKKLFTILGFPLGTLLTAFHPYYFFWSSVFAAKFSFLSRTVTIVIYLSLFLLIRYAAFHVLVRFFHGHYHRFSKTYAHFIKSHVLCIFYIPVAILSVQSEVPNAFIFLSAVSTIILGPIVYYLESRLFVQSEPKLKLKILISCLLVLVLIMSLRSKEVLTFLDRYSVLSLLTLAGPLSVIGEFSSVVTPICFVLLSIPLFYFKRPSIVEFNRLIKLDVKQN